MTTALSLAEQVSHHPALESVFIQNLSPLERALLKFTWSYWARPEQRTPSKDFFVWALMAGRGFGKTRTGAEFVWEEIQALRQKYSKVRYAIVGQTPADVRHVMMEGESGLLNVCPPWDRPVYSPSTREAVWPDGTVAFTYSGMEPGQLRGPQHHGGWIDEFSKMRYAQETLDNFLFGLRLGRNPRACATFTPRNIPAVRDLLSDPDTAVTTGSMLRNLSNLPPKFIRRILRRYEGTRLGQQEIEGRLILKTPGALWTSELLEANRVAAIPCPLKRIAVAVDPGASHTDKEKETNLHTDDDAELPETGIVCGGLGEDGHVYVFDDVSGNMSPGQWGDTVVDAYQHHRADVVVGELNNGGDMVEHTVHVAAKAKNALIRFVGIRASRGKYTRAEPVAALYEKGKVHHVGNWPDLEDQMTTWTPGKKSPDRMDALVWLVYHLLVGTEDELVML